MEIVSLADSGGQAQTKSKRWAKEQKQSQSKAMGINIFIVNGIRSEQQKQSHGDHRPLLQSFTAILTRFSRKLLPMARLSTLPI
ncbi:MAG: hypothetical protein ACLQOO_16375 [Terriglobia bacterium]